MSYNFHKNYSIFWVKDPDSENPNKKRPMVILFKYNNDYILAKITTKYKDYNRYCCVLDEWLEAGLNKPSCIRLDKLINLKENKLFSKDYIGYLGETDILMVQSMLSSLYDSNKNQL